MTHIDWLDIQNKGDNKCPLNKCVLRNAFVKRANVALFVDKTDLFCRIMSIDDCLFRLCGHTPQRRGARFMDEFVHKPCT